MAVAVMVLGCVSTATAETPPPLFAAFKAFCADTHANPAAVTDAIVQAGGKLKGSHTNNAPPPNLDIGSAWQVTVGGHELLVLIAINEDVGRPSGRRTRTESCSIMSFNNEMDSVPLLRRWPGVAPDTDDKNKSGVGTIWISYAEADGVRTPLVSAQSQIAAEDAGRAWHLQVIYDRSSSNVVFFRTMTVRKP